LIDFIFSSSKKKEDNHKFTVDATCSHSKREENDVVYSVNITIIIYETDLHHCLLEYKIYFVEQNSILKYFLKSELIGDSLVIF